jgi:hypothetical protein
LLFCREDGKTFFTIKAGEDILLRKIGLAKKALRHKEKSLAFIASQFYFAEKSASRFYFFAFVVYLFKKAGKIFYFAKLG